MERNFLNHKNIGKLSVIYRFLSLLLTFKIPGDLFYSHSTMRGSLTPILLLCIINLLKQQCLKPWSDAQIDMYVTQMLQETSLPPRDLNINFP